MTISSSTGIWTIGNNWPWPQIRFTSYYNLAFAQKSDGKLSLYELTYNNGWQASEMVQLGNVANVVSVSIADFQTYYLIAVDAEINGSPDRKVFAKNPTTGAVSLLTSSTLMAAGTICAYQGQLILGDLMSNDAPWKHISACSVAWSDIGSIKTNPENYVVAGYAQMPWDEKGNGRVWKVLPFDKVIIVYGDRGITSLTPYTVERIVGLGIGHVVTPGILSADSIDGDEKVHGFIDANYDWWIASGNEVKNLGYRKYMKTLTNGRIIVRYNEYNKRFYISDGVLSFVYTKNGMYSTNQCVSSIGNYNNTLCGFFLDNSDTKIRWVTSGNDFNIQGHKTIESVEVGVSYSEDLHGALSLKYEYNGDFIQLAWTNINPRGIFTQKATSREFKIHFDADYVADKEFHLSSLMAKVKIPDKRNIRGKLNVN
jgi:hypothetical protein